VNNYWSWELRLGDGVKDVQNGLYYASSSGSMKPPAEAAVGYLS